MGSNKISIIVGAKDKPDREIRPDGPIFLGDFKRRGPDGKLDISPTPLSRIARRSKRWGEVSEEVLRIVNGWPGLSCREMYEKTEMDCSYNTLRGVAHRLARKRLVEKRKDNGELFARFYPKGSSVGIDAVIEEKDRQIIKLMREVEEAHDEIERLMEELSRDKRFRES